jgi:hypothetical protein
MNQPSDSNHPINKNIKQIKPNQTCTAAVYKTKKQRNNYLYGIILLYEYRLLAMGWLNEAT